MANAICFPRTVIRTVWKATKTTVKAKEKNMNNRFDELTKNLAQSVTRRAPLKKFGVGLAGMALAGLLTMPCAAANPNAQTSTVFDPAEDAVFPYDLYGAPVPPYLDIVRVSVSFARG